jgi:hypothetical protein
MFFELFGGELRSGICANACNIEISVVANVAVIGLIPNNSIYNTF